MFNQIIQMQKKLQQTDVVKICMKLVGKGPGWCERRPKTVKFHLNTKIDRKNSNWG